MRIFWAVVFMMMVFLKAGQGQLLDTTSNENDHLKRQCVNPNRRLGACVALDDCQVLQTSDEDFIIKSVCNEDFDKIPMVCCSSDVGFDAIPNGGHRNGKKLSWWPSVLKMFLSSLKSSNRNDFRPARKVKEPLVQNSLLPEPPICGGEFINNRIYGGTETHIYEFPWMAFLEYTKAGKKSRKDMNKSFVSSTIVRYRDTGSVASCPKGG
ncbi:serine protease ea-like [Haematobia irritans]|uniref:serine protease ea-like n=1 Tax=Haematobia irritans TaxID=7368 RepID=UPI003F50B06E